MSYDFGGDDPLVAVPIERSLSKTPQNVIVSLSVVGILVAAFRNPAWSAVAYLLVLLAGCGLLFYDRVRSVTASRAGVVSARYVTRYDKIAVALLLIACLLNGLVVAAHLARG